MAALGKTYTAGDVDTEQRDFDNLPSGIVKMEVTESSVGPTKAGTGQMLKYTSTLILPEELKGRKFFGQINLENPSSQAQEIGQKEFGAMRRAMELGDVDDSEQLHFIPYTVKLDWGKPSKDGQHPGKMEVKRYYFPDEGNVPEPAIDEVQKPQPPATGKPAASKPAAANNNQRPASNDNRQAATTPAAATAGKARPWGKK